jgi:AraC-like DNA-binding protein
LYFFDIMDSLQLIQPAPALRSVVQSYWVMWQPPDHEAYMHPGGSFGMVFNLGATFDGRRDRVFLDGTNTVSRRLHMNGETLAVGVRFQVGGAYPFLRMPLHEVNNELVDLPYRDLHDQLMDTPTIPAKIHLLENWLLHQDFGDPNPMITASLQLIQRGQLNMKELADELFISQRQLERLYRTHVGMTPIQYARLLRVEKARHILTTYHQFSTAQVGAMLDYYDQSHFIRDFKAVVGITPMQYRVEKSDPV